MPLVNHLIAFGLRQILGEHAETAITLSNIVQKHFIKCVRNRLPTGANRRRP